MKRYLLILGVLPLLAACSAPIIDTGDDTAPVGSLEGDSVTISIQFTPYEQSPMTRTATSIADYCTALDIWIDDGDEQADYHQTTGDSGFGALSLTLNSTKQYTLYAVAHKCTSPASLSYGVISFPDDKVTHSFFFSSTFTPTKGMNMNCLMQRIVAQFSFTTADQVPSWCKTMRFTIYDIYDRWNVTTGGTHSLDRVSTFENFTTKNDGTVTFNIYAIVTSSNTSHDVLVEALNADGDVVEQHLFEDVPLRNGYKTAATGNFFTDAAATFSFTAEEWNTNTPYNF